MCANVVFLLLALEDATVTSVLRSLGDASVKFLWHLRVGLDGLLPAEATRLRADRLMRLLDTVPGVVASGEMTAWSRLLSGDERMCAFT